MKKKHSHWYYLSLFLGLWTIFFTFDSKVQASEYDSYCSDHFLPNAEIEINHLRAALPFMHTSSSEDEYSYSSSDIPNAKMEIKHMRAAFMALGGIEALSPSEKQYYQEKIKFHYENGERTYYDAKNRCWWLPNLTDREKARYCFTSAGSLIFPNDAKSKLVATTVQLLIQYGLGCIDEWSYIKNKLHWSEYHYEMMEFYQEVFLQG